MKTFAFAGIAAGLALCAPAQAMEHKTVIEHPVRPDRSGTTPAQPAWKCSRSALPGLVVARTSLRCQWSVSLSVERHAQVGASLQAKRSMLRNDVIKGTSPGWCSERGSGIGPRG